MRMKSALVLIYDNLGRIIYREVAQMALLVTIIMLIHDDNPSIVIQSILIGLLQSE